MVELVYLDETGSVGRGARRQPLLRLVGVVVKEETVERLGSRMTELAMEHLGWRPTDFEFHAYELWNARDPWVGKEPAELLAAYEAVIALLAELDIWVVHSAIRKSALHERYDGRYDSNAYLLALQFLLGKLDNWRTGAMRIVVADEAKEHETRAIRLVRDMQTWGNGVVPGRQLQTVIDSMHYVDSRDSPGVQLADFVAFVLHRSTLPGQGHPDADAAVARMRSAVDDRTYTWREPWPAEQIE
ncbi:DUF3800 domain-containing protein [Microbacterium sp. BLY]|uniref:DUF3800 domain-containing protein n=1 Tax=Microbacterium sp. BLY TaxID=2823280 RepID=UPI001B32FCE0|nr:DUF3800 domain-containing protein [Microbacterium sp. BLY]MBP3977856.1 DUF3800 domain-containing protein [Microbacterium sp. BLY]